MPFLPAACAAPGRRYTELQSPAGLSSGQRRCRERAPGVVAGQARRSSQYCESLRHIIRDPRRNWCRRRRTSVRATPVGLCHAQRKLLTRLGDVREHFTCRSGGRQLSNVHLTVGHLREKQHPLTGLDSDVRRFEGGWRQRRRHQCADHRRKDHRDKQMARIASSN